MPDVCVHTEACRARHVADKAAQPKAAAVGAARLAVYPRRTGMYMCTVTDGLLVLHIQLLCWTPTSAAEVESVPCVRVAVYHCALCEGGSLPLCPV
jgi:hypothetical protein